MAANNEEELSLKHKKERKEMQAQIQAMKKSVTKGDKKKKKEMTEKIAFMESDLDKRHDEEMANLMKNQMNLLPPEEKETETLPEDEEEDQSTDCNKPMQKVSKAQKRRAKKAQAEKDRQQDILEQDVVNKQGKRALEIKAIEKRLEARDLMLHEVPSDGHCLYNAVAHQVKVHQGSSMNQQDLRNRTCEYLLANEEEFLPFMSHPDSEELFAPEQYQKHCENIAKTSAWGGAVELQVLSRVLESPIEVVQAYDDSYVIGDTFEMSKKLIVTYHRHIYELGSHYNSTKKFIEQDIEECLVR